MMIDKKILKTYIICLIISVSLLLLPMMLLGGDDAYNKLRLYNLPFGENARQQGLFFYLLALFAPLLAIFIGYGLAYIVVRVYCRFTKFSQRIEFVGYANIDRSGKYLRKRYLIQLIFGVLLCVNIWIALVTNIEIMEFWVAEEYKDLMYEDSGQMYNFPMVPWYWLPLFITTLVFAMCSVITDSGLVTIKKLSGQSEFSDTERVGDKLFGAVKGYAGISVIISFILLIQSPMGNEGSLVIYPIFYFLSSFYSASIFFYHK